MADQKTEDTKSPLPRRGARPFAGPAGAARPFLRPATTPQRATAAPFLPPVVPGKPALGIPPAMAKGPTPVAAQVIPEPVTPTDVDVESRTRPVTSEMIALDAFDAFETVWGSQEAVGGTHQPQPAVSSPLDEASLGTGTDAHQDWAEEITAPASDVQDVVAGELETAPAPAVEPTYATPDGAIPAWLEDGGSITPLMPTEAVVASEPSAPMPEAQEPTPAWPSAANDASYAITEWTDTDAHTIPPADDFQPAAAEWSDAPVAPLPEPSLGKLLEAPSEPAPEVLTEPPYERPRFELVSLSQETEALPDTTPDPRTTRDMRCAAVLDRLANRIRSGEIDVSSIAPDAPDAAVLASVLAALLGGSSSR